MFAVFLQYFAVFLLYFAVFFMFYSVQGDGGRQMSDPEVVGAARVFLN